MKSNPTRIAPLKGMYSLRTGEGDITQPRIVLNADVGDSGRISKRAGFEKVIDLPGAHSLFSSGNRMYCADPSAIYVIDDGGARSLTTHFSPPGEPISWAEAGNIIYFANPYVSGKIDSNNEIHDWEPGRPPAVDLVVTSDGGLPAGRYHLAFTLNEDPSPMGTGSGPDISVPGPVRTIDIPENGKITVTNRPDGGTVWMSDPNGPLLYRAGRISHLNTVPATVEPMPDISLRSRPPAIRCLAFAFGRMWAGSASGLLYFSEPYRPSWYRQDAYFDLGDSINTIAAVNTGIFVGTITHTVFLEGTDPARMAEKPCGPGSIRGTVQYVDGLMEMGDMLSPPEKIHQSVPVWLQADGIVAGNDAGRVFGLSQKSVRMSPPTNRPGAGLFRRGAEGFQYLTTFESGDTPDGAKLGDSVTARIIREGEI